MARRFPYRPGDPGYPVARDATVTRYMRGNRRRDTSSELEIRRLLHARGLRYRVDYRIEAGHTRARADIVFTRAKLVVFIDGCYWHGCPEHSRSPKRNANYWRAKLERNRCRDRRVSAALEDAGWRVLRIWSHVPADEAADIVVRALAAG